MPKDWDQARTECQQSLPGILAAGTLPDVLLPYQQRVISTIDANEVTVVEKSRRIGLTWGVGAEAVLYSGTALSEGGMDTIYVGYNLDMAREFIDTCAMWAKTFMPAASAVSEFLFKDQDKHGVARDILAFRITFASGFEIVALTSKPRSLRGRQGFLIFDEAAFHEDLPGMMKAAMAFLMWGGKILVISTHDGDTNPFNGLVNDIRAGRKPYALLRITFDDAIREGLYERIRMMLEARGQHIDEKDEWIAKIRAFYGDDAEEELDVIPAQGTGTALSSALIESRMDADIPVVTFSAPKGFVEWPDHLREAEAADWCESTLRPLLIDLPEDLFSFFGLDFGRLHDLTVIWPIQTTPNLTRRPPFVVELFDVPFEQQKQILFYIVDRLPRFRSGAMDATGIGAYLAEVAAQKYGMARVAQVKLSIEWYRENMPRFIAAFEDGTIALPKDADILNDHRILRKVNGVIQVPALRLADTKNRDRKRHGDSVIANALAFFASTMDVAPIDYRAAGLGRAAARAFGPVGIAAAGQAAAHTGTGFGTAGPRVDYGGPYR